MIIIFNDNNGIGYVSYSVFSAFSVLDTSRSIARLQWSTDTQNGAEVMIAGVQGCDNSETVA